MSATRVDPHDPLTACPEAQHGLVLPTPLSARLDALVQIARDGGERTNRKELIAALILAASESDTAIARAVRTYRRATVQNAFVAGQDREPFLDTRPSPRGPRRRTAPVARPIDRTPNS